MLPIKEIKPKNARAKREVEKKLPKERENPKKTLFLHGTSTSLPTILACRDLVRLKQPLCKQFKKKNDIRPFEDPASLEFFSEKEDVSLLVFYHNSKKRPHCMTFIRMFNHKLLDMLEFYIDKDTFRTLSDFKNEKFSAGLKPMITFHGTPFENPNQTKYTLAKSLLLDFFRGDEVPKIDVAGLQYMISISAEEEEDGQPAPTIRLRVYKIKTKKSGQKLPRVEVDEIGPRIDFRVGREKFADEAMWKDAMKKPKGTEARTKKNIETDLMGDKVGKIHVGKQDFGQLQTRKMKGLKRNRDGAGSDDETMVDAGEEDPAPKKIRENSV